MNKLSSIQGIPLDYIQSVLKIDPIWKRYLIKISVFTSFVGIYKGIHSGE